MRVDAASGMAAGAHARPLGPPLRIALLGVSGAQVTALAQAVMPRLDACRAVADACAPLQQALERRMNTAPPPERGARDACLRALAAEHAATYALTLLLGLVPCGLAPLHGTHERWDSLLRATLDGADIPYRVLYGSPEARLASTLLALRTIDSAALGAETCGLLVSAAGPAHAKWRAWACEKCSDPACEYRLFTALRK